MTEGKYDFMEMRVAPPEGAICDFCSSPDVHWTFPCRDHSQGTEHFGALVIARDGSSTIEKMDLDGFASGGWAACNPCHALILRGDRVRLARRSAKRMVRSLPDNLLMSLGEATVHIRRLHDKFWANREGAPVYHETRPMVDPTKGT